MGRCEPEGADVKRSGPAMKPPATTDVPLTTAEAAYLYALLVTEGPDDEDAELIEKLKAAL